MGARRNVDSRGRTALVERRTPAGRNGGRESPNTTGSPAFRRRRGTTMRRWILVGVLCLSVGAPGAVFSATAAASTTPSHRCDGDHDRDDVGCPVRRPVRVAVVPRPVVVRPRVTG